MSWLGKLYCEYGDFSDRYPTIMQFARDGEEAGYLLRLILLAWPVSEARRLWASGKI